MRALHFIGIKYGITLNQRTDSGVITAILFTAIIINSMPVNWTNCVDAAKLCSFQWQWINPEITRVICYFPLKAFLNGRGSNGSSSLNELSKFKSVNSNLKSYVLAQIHREGKSIVLFFSDIQLMTNVKRSFTSKFQHNQWANLQWIFMCTHLALEIIRKLYGKWFWYRAMGNLQYRCSAILTQRNKNGHNSNSNTMRAVRDAIWSGNVKCNVIREQNNHQHSI